MIKFKPDWSLKNQKTVITVPIFQGTRVMLRPPRLEDYNKWRQVRAYNQSFLKPFEPQWPKDCLTENFFKRRLARQKKEMLGGRGAFFLIFLKETDEIVGGINLNNIQLGAARNASLGYWLVEDKQGQGYMFEAAELAIKYAFDDLKLHRLHAACLPDNDRSARLLLKLGFEEEGFAKQYLKINGKWQDHRLFGLVNLLLT